MIVVRTDLAPEVDAFSVVSHLFSVLNVFSVWITVITLFRSNGHCTRLSAARVPKDVPSESDAPGQWHGESGDVRPPDIPQLFHGVGCLAWSRSENGVPGNEFLLSVDS